MHHNLTESSEKNGSCFTILAIVALASGGLLGGSAWLKGYSFLPFFVAGAGFIFSIYWIVRISEKGMPIWKGIEHYCNLWRITRTGILLYGARHDAPAIFLPWLSIYSVTHADDCILVDTEDCITFTLPVDSGKTESALSLITEQITKHQNKYIGEKKSPAYLQRAPQKTGLLTFLKVGVPWFIVGIAIPFSCRMNPGRDWPAQSALLLGQSLSCSVTAISSMNMRQKASWVTTCATPDKVCISKVSRDGIISNLGLQ